jgi:hypothetical protein
LWKAPASIAGQALAREHGPGGAVPAGDRLGGFERLTRRVAAAPRLVSLAPVHEEVHAGAPLFGAEADVVGGALVGEVAHSRQGVVDREQGGARQQGAERARGLRRLQAAMQVAEQVGRGEVQATVGAVGGRVTVAALAAHMGEAEAAAPATSGASRHACRSTSASRPAKPSWRRKATSGRSCGGRTNCGTPRSCKTRIFASPSSAAARGFDTAPWLAALARLPGERPA